MQNRYCTIPKIFGLRKWFEKRFGELCKAHDVAYINRSGTRLEADWDMYFGMAEKGYPVTAFVTYYMFLRPFGWLYWYDWIK